LEKNSQKKAMRKPEVGDVYRLFENCPLMKSFLIEITRVSAKEDQVFYISLIDGSPEKTWDYLRFPECLNYKVSSLEVELL